MSICSGIRINEKTATYTKYLTVSFILAYLNIPTQWWDFIGSQPQHSNCIMQFSCGGMDRRFFAGC